jgi:hypothetical protein
LIDSLVKINNETDSSFVEYQGVVNKEKEQLLIKLNALEKNNNTLSAQFDKLGVKNTELTQLIDRYQKKSKNDLLLLSSIGPSFNILDNSLGIEITLGAIHRISVFNLFDFYAGLNINTNIYYQEVRAKISYLGIGAVLGIFLK